MLLLCSNGLTSDLLISQVQRHLPECGTAALVVTADPVYKENNYHVSRSRNTLESFGLSVEIFDLDFQPAEELLRFDVVEFIGGNPFYLLHVIRTHDAQNVLKKLATEKLLIGWSAAAFVFGPSLKLVNRYSPEMNYLNLTDLTGLSLSSVEVLPHYSRFLSKFEHFEETCRTYEKEHDITVFRLNDGEGIWVDAGKVEICRSIP